MIELDQIDNKAASVLDGYLVRKDLVRTFSRQFPVPTYVVEFMLGRYCASIDQEEIDEGLEIVQRQLKSRTVRAGEEELFKAKALETGEVKIIDLVTARVDNKGEYVASLPSLRLTDVRISSELVNQHERMLTGGFYAELSVTFDVAIAQEAKGRPFGITSLREIQLSKRDVLDTLAKARQAFTTEEWTCFLLRSIGIESGGLSDRQRNALLLRMVPFVERNYNLVELGPRGTGKSHLFQQVSPYAHLISGGKATVAKMFVENTAKGRRGLVCQYDVVCFDEVSGISFDQKDGVNIMTGMGRSYRHGGPASRQGAAETGWCRRVSEHPFQLCHGRRRRREVRLHTGAPKRQEHRRRPAGAWAGVDHQPRRRGGELRPLPHRGQRRPRIGLEGAQQAHSSRVPREHRLRRAEPIRQVQTVGWRQGPQTARAHGTAAGV